MQKHLRTLFTASLFALPSLGFAQGPGMGSPPAGNQATGNQATGNQAAGIFLNMPQFEIPFSVASVGTQPQEVQLYISRDAGSKWELIARQPATSRNFPFSAPADGDYWFATRTIDTNGAAHPAGPVQPQLRVTVDTTNPELDARADADGNGQVILDYRITDDAPMAESLRVEYMTDAVRQWMPVKAASQPLFQESPGKAEGRIVWVPESDWRHVYIRMIVRDRAGNQTVLTRQVEKPRVAKQETPAQLASSPLLPPPAPPNEEPPVYSNPAALAAMASNRNTVGPLTGRPQPSALANQRFNPVYAPTASPPVTPRGWDAITPTQPDDPQSSATADYGQRQTPPTPSANSGLATRPQQETRQQEAWSSAPQTQPNWPTPHVAQGPAATATPATSDARPANGADDFGLNPPAYPPTAPSDTASPDTAPQDAGPQRRPEDALRPLNRQNGVPQQTESQNQNQNRYQPETAPRYQAETAPAPVGMATPAPADMATPAPTVTPNFPRPDSQIAPRTPPAASTAPAQRSRRVSIADTIPSGATVRQSNSRTFSLDYELESVGRNGVDTVELWATKDMGKTWDYWDADPDGQSPFDIITAGDGVYGFRMVVVGRNGLTSPRPTPGEDADIYILVDTNLPTVRITGARYGEQEDTGNLLITYDCDDPLDNLARRPITLKFAETPQGPWTTIATGLDSDGFYAWPADPELPGQIYLRIEAIDAAGNVGQDTLDRPIAVEGLAPRARIRGFQPVRDETATAPRARFK